MWLLTRAPCPSTSPPPASLQPEVALASSGAFVHVPFLRSGMFAAHQGYGLQSELSRVRLQSRVLGPQAALEAAAAADGEFAAAGRSSGSSSAIAGLQSVMEASRAVAGEAEEEARRGRGRPRTRPQDPPRPPKVSAKLFGTTPEQRSSQLPMLPGLTVAVATPEELKMCLGEDSKQVLRSDAAVMEEDLSEELVDAAAAQQDWEAHLAAAASGAAAAARAVGAGDSTLAPLSPSRNFQYEQLKPQPPAASCAAVLEALGQLEGVDVSGPDGIVSGGGRCLGLLRCAAVNRCGVAELAAAAVGALANVLLCIGLHAMFSSSPPACVSQLIVRASGPPVPPPPPPFSPTLLTLRRCRASLSAGCGAPSARGPGAGTPCHCCLWSLPPSLRPACSRCWPWPAC